MERTASLHFELGYQDKMEIRGRLRWPGPCVANATSVPFLLLPCSTSSGFAKPAGRFPVEEPPDSVREDLRAVATPE